MEGSGMMEAYRKGKIQAFSDHLFRGAAYVKTKAKYGIIAHSDEFNLGYRDYTRRRCVVRREVL